MRKLIDYQPLFKAIENRGFDPSDRASQIALTREYNAYVLNVEGSISSRNRFDRIFSRSQKTVNSINADLLCGFLRVSPKDIFKEEKENPFFQPSLRVMSWLYSASWWLRTWTEHSINISLSQIVETDKARILRSGCGEYEAFYEDLAKVYTLLVLAKYAQAYNLLKEEIKVDPISEVRSSLESSLSAHKAALCVLVLNDPTYVDQPLYFDVANMLPVLTMDSVIRLPESSQFNGYVKDELGLVFSEQVIVDALAVAKTVHARYVFSSSARKGKGIELYEEVFTAELLAKKNSKQATSYLDPVKARCMDMPIYLHIYFLVVCGFHGRRKNNVFLPDNAKSPHKVEQILGLMLSAIAKDELGKGWSIQSCYNLWLLYSSLELVAASSWEMAKVIQVRTHFYWHRSWRKRSLKKIPPKGKISFKYELILFSFLIYLIALADCGKGFADQANAMRLRFYKEYQGSLTADFKQLYSVTLEEGFGFAEHERELAISLIRFLYEEQVDPKPDSKEPRVHEA